MKVSGILFCDICDKSIPDEMSFQSINGKMMCADCIEDFSKEKTEGKADGKARCQVCGGMMEKTTMPPHAAWVLIGGLFIISGVIAVFFVFVTGVIFGIYPPEPEGYLEARQKVSAIISFIARMILAGTIPFLIGYVLAKNKKVLACKNCGAFVPRK